MRLKQFKKKHYCPGKKAATKIGGSGGKGREVGDIDDGKGALNNFVILSLNKAIALKSEIK